MTFDSDGNHFIPDSVRRGRRSNDHIDYPHIPGYLDACPRCNVECFCGNNTPPGEGKPSCCYMAAVLPDACHTECVYCALMAEAEDGQEREMTRREMVLEEVLDSLEREQR